MRDIDQILYVGINGSLSITPAPKGQLTNAPRRAISTRPDPPGAQLAHPDR